MVRILMRTNNDDPQQRGKGTWVLCARDYTSGVLINPPNNLGKGILMMSFYWGLGCGTEQKHMP